MPCQTTAPGRMKAAGRGGIGRKSHRPTVDTHIKDLSDDSQRHGELLELNDPEHEGAAENSHLIMTTEGHLDMVGRGKMMFISDDQKYSALNRIKQSVGVGPDVRSGDTGSEFIVSIDTRPVRPLCNFAPCRSCPVIGPNGEPSRTSLGDGPPYEKYRLVPFNTLLRMVTIEIRHSSDTSEVVVAYAGRPSSIR